jgi:molybdopterin-containing oxidoreductase family iron-sulfur binding subunit
MEIKGNGKEYYRSLEQLAQTDEFKDFLHREFPKGTAELANNAWSRRSFLTTMGASLALAGLTGCRRPVEKIVPFVTRPEEIDPGVPNKYATTMPLGLSAYGVVVTTYEGRPTFIAGNELHPSSRGAVNPIIQASLLDLYDPDRSKTVLKDGKESTWDDFVVWWKEQHAKYKENGGEGLAVLTETFNSPTLARLRREFEKTFPRAKWVAWEPVSDENVYKGIELATGQVLQPVYDFGKAKVVLSLDSDFLGTESETVANTRGFAEARKVRSQTDEMNRLYVVEPSMTVTGMMADHRMRMKSHDVANFAATLAHRLAELNQGFKELANLPTPKVEFDKHFVDAVADDLLHAGPNMLVVAGRRQPAAVHALALAINQAAGNTGSLAEFYPMSDAEPVSSNALRRLEQNVARGGIDTLVTLGGNPAYDLPSQFWSALQKKTNRISFSTQVDETALNSTWHLPRSHYLESWGDTRSASGVPSVSQPVIAPMYDSKGEAALVSLLITGEIGDDHAIVRDTWKQLPGQPKGDDDWRRVLHDGVGQTVSAARLPQINMQAVGAALGKALFLETPEHDGVELSFGLTSLFDGRFANNGWLQELPDPVTKLTWGNAALVSPKFAQEHKLENEDVVTLEANGRSIEIPVWISPGQADNSISVALGYGRTAAGRVGNGVGVDAYKLRSGNEWFVGGVKITKTGRKQEMACTQDHGSMKGRPIIRENTLAGYKEKAEFFPEEIAHPPLESLWDEHKYDTGYQWGMSIDLNACTGCNACVTACQAENNIPVIGKEQVRNGREMHWMRLDRYYAGDIEEPEVAVQPMNCQHCEMAPCEQVCPVAATSHDSEGLNVMVYNRCIGTRYCSNNCPYKVRRFNFFNYTNDLPETVKMVQNPEVTVRFRGVMEKCTYCIQRIAVGKINAKNEGRMVADGEIKTACQSACPSQAIVFGNINDPNSEVAKLRANNRKYRVLEELNTRPRTTYLAKLRNPNPALVSEAKPEDDGHHG